MKAGRNRQSCENNNRHLGDWRLAIVDIAYVDCARLCEAHQADARASAAIRYSCF